MAFSPLTKGDLAGLPFTLQQWLSKLVQNTVYIGSAITSGLTMSTNKVLGRATAGAGAIEELSTTGSGNVVLATSPTLVTPILGTPTSGNLVNCTGYSITGGTFTRATADQTLTSTATLTNVTNLSFAIASGEEFTAEFLLDVGDALSITGIKLAATIPSGATLNLIASTWGALASNSTFRTVSGATSLDFTNIAMASADTSQFIVSLWCLNSTTAGTVQLQFAQSTSSATALKIRKGSHMNARKVN